MFEIVGQWDIVLPILAAALTGGVVWATARPLTRWWSVEGRLARRKTRRLERLARACGLRVDPAHDLLQGRVQGWSVEVRPTWKPMRTGGVPTEHWDVRLRADATGAGPLRNLHRAPNQLAPVTRDGPDLIAVVPLADADQLPHQLAWMVDLAVSLHAAVAPEAPREAALHEACSSLGLRADDTLPRWEGTWRGRSVLVEHWTTPGLVHVHLGIRVGLPHGLWVGARDSFDASGEPVPLPLRTSSGTLAATADPAGAEAARVLLRDPLLLDTLSTHLTDGRGSRVYGDGVVLVRSPMAFSVAPVPVLAAAEAIAQALETAVERPWRTLAESQGLTMSPERVGGLPVLRGHRLGFAVTLRCSAGMDAVQVQARPVDLELARGLRIEAGPGRGLSTTNPILDQHLSVMLAEPVETDVLAKLPADALLPLFLEEAYTEISASGVTVVVSSRPIMASLATVLDDLDRLLPALPRTAATSA